MASLKLYVHGWQDGRYVQTVLEQPDRWVMHTADKIVVEFDEYLTIDVLQKPNAITAKRMGVGACLWEGELLLAAYLMAQPHHRYQGARCIELGSGPGLVGLLLAKLGAKVISGLFCLLKLVGLLVQAVITDKEVVLPLIQDNIGANGLVDEHRAGDTGSAQVEALEWGAEGYLDTVARLSARPVDWVLAADCCYIDQDGTSPSTPAFIQACKGLCKPGVTRVLVSFELRSEAVKSTFLEEAHKEFKHVERLGKSALPKCYQVDHIELYQLRL